MVCLVGLALAIPGQQEERALGVSERASALDPGDAAELLQTKDALASLLQREQELKEDFVRNLLKSVPARAAPEGATVEAPPSLLDLKEVKGADFVRDLLKSVPVRRAAPEPAAEARTTALKSNTASAAAAALQSGAAAAPPSSERTQDEFVRELLDRRARSRGAPASRPPPRSSATRGTRPPSPRHRAAAARSTATWRRARGSTCWR